MKALTICQPYASLIVNPPHIKRVENRTWRTSHRGRLAIHAGKSKEWLDSWDENQMPDPMPFGKIICVANLAICLHIDVIRRGVSIESFKWLNDHEHCEGPYCWVLEDIQPLVKPFPCKGGLNLWTVPQELVDQIKEQIK